MITPQLSKIIPGRDPGKIRNNYTIEVIAKSTELVGTRKICYDTGR
jgi:hypothetical protein